MLEPSYTEKYCAGRIMFKDDFFATCMLAVGAIQSNGNGVVGDLEGMKQKTLE